MAQDPDIRLLTSPRIFLVGMAAFLALVGFVVLILYQQIALAFSANPGLNGLILGVLAIGALFTFRQVIRLFREIRWVTRQELLGLDFLEADLSLVHDLAAGKLI